MTAPRIIGGGIAGLALATRLGRQLGGSPARITLVNGCIPVAAMPVASGPPLHSNHDAGPARGG